MIRTYSELITLPTYEERFKYLSLKGEVGKVTFGYDRYLNQYLYNSPEWRRFRRDIIIRDKGCDLACEGYEIHMGRSTAGTRLLARLTHDDSRPIVIDADGLNGLFAFGWRAYNCTPA